MTNTTSEIKKLKTTFSKDGVSFLLIKRTDDVAMYGLYGYYGGLIGIEVFRITIKKPDRYSPTQREYFPSAEDSGKSHSSLCHCGVGKEDAAEAHYQALVKTSASAPAEVEGSVGMAKEIYGDTQGMLYKPLNQKS